MAASRVMIALVECNLPVRDNGGIGSGSAVRGTNEPCSRICIISNTKFTNRREKMRKFTLIDSHQ